ncbi:MAG TPA: enolase C-terminal domain-like protein [Burkholderiales bacterium]|nr:enolase C-terminal domain-like protein [Burkholderiales bacterium]
MTDAAAVQRIATVTLHLLKVPLAVPYKLSFGKLTAFDTLLVEVEHEDGGYGVGEATYLAGYSDETPENGWQLARRLAQSLVGMDTEEARNAIDPHIDDAAFTATALNTAIELLEGNAILDVRAQTRVPILGLLHATAPAEIERESSELFAQGYRTLKVKVGFDVARDLELVKDVQRAVRGRGTIRLDANQGYSRDDACRFAQALDPQDIELFEQPCAAGDWEAAQAVARVATVPMMLDESIYGLADIERAAELRAARYIKLKLMKLGGLSRLSHAIETIRECGMEPVLGNGVACEIGCWMEACVARSHITNAGEMNGFLKPVAPLLETPLPFADGAVQLKQGFTPRLDTTALARMQTMHETFDKRQ